MIDQLRADVWEMWYRKKNNYKNAEFWKGLSNRIENGQGTRQVRRRRLFLVKTAQKIEKYHAAYENYLRPVSSSCEQEMLDEYVSEKKLALHILGKLGGGAFGNAYLALDKSKEHFFCIKVIDRTQILERLSELEIDIEGRIKWAKKIEEVYHDEIIALYDFFENLSMYVFQMEYFPGISLAACWEQLLKLDSRSKLALLEKILQGIKCLHLFRWAHRDLHAGNILIDVLESGDIKIIDFDLSRKGDDDKDSIWGAGTRAPERVNGICGKEVDIWAFGDLAYKLLAGIDNPARFVLMEQGRFPRDLGEEIKSVLTAARASVPEKRPSAKSIHMQIRAWRQRYLFVENLTLHRRFCSSLLQMRETGEGRLIVGTQHGTACIYFRDGKLVEAMYGKMRGREVLEDLCDETRLLSYVDMESASPPRSGFLGTYWFKMPVSASLKQSLHRLEDGIISQNLLDLFRQNDMFFSCKATVETIGTGREWLLKEGEQESTLTIKDGKMLEVYLDSPYLEKFLQARADAEDSIRCCREEVKAAVARSLAIETDAPVLCRLNSCSEQRQSWAFENLLYGSNIYLYAQDRYHLTPMCMSCITVDAKNRQTPTPRLNAGYRGYRLVFLDANICTQFYLGFKERQARMFLLYLKPPGIINDNKWEMVLKRLKRGYEILSDYPCRHFTNLLDFHPTKIGDEKFAVLTMEYFPGIYLRQALNQKIPLADRTAAAILLDLARALVALHDKGVVHRNITPSSILLGVNGQTKLGDFSQCKYEPGSPAEEDHLQVTVNITGPSLGANQLYSSPECLENMAQVTLKSDIWSWGALAYRLVAGKAPFKRNTVRQGLQAVYQAKVDMNPVPALFKGLISDSLAKDEKKRPHARDIAAELEEMLQKSNLFSHMG